MKTYRSCVSIWRLVSSSAICPCGRHTFQKPIWQHPALRLTMSHTAHLCHEKAAAKASWLNDLPHRQWYRSHISHLFNEGWILSMGFFDVKDFSEVNASNICNSSLFVWINLRHLVSRSHQRSCVANFSRPMTSASTISQCTIPMICFRWNHVKGLNRENKFTKKRLFCCLLNRPLSLRWQFLWK